MATTGVSSSWTTMANYVGGFCSNAANISKLTFLAIKSLVFPQQQEGTEIDRALALTEKIFAPWQALPEHRLTLCVFKALSRSPIDVNGLLPNPSHLTIPSLIDDLEAFTRELPQTEQLQRVHQLFEKVKSDLQFAKRILLFSERPIVEKNVHMLISLPSWLSFVDRFLRRTFEPIQSMPLIQHPDLPEIAAREILQKLDSLSQTGPKSFIVPGGYFLPQSLLSGKNQENVQGHLVLYKIQLQEDGRYSLTIIDSGESKATMNKLKPLFEVMDDALDKAKAIRGNKTEEAQDQTDGDIKELLDKDLELAQKLTDITEAVDNASRIYVKIYQEMKKMRIKDPCYINIPKGHLNETFFKTLLEFFSISIGAAAMNVVREFIHASLFNSGEPNLIERRSHTIQTRDNCTVKPYMLWLHEELGPLYPLFKRVLIMREVDKCIAINESAEFTSSDFVQALQATSLEENSDRFQGIGALREITRQLIRKVKHIKAKYG